MKTEQSAVIEGLKSLPAVEDPHLSKRREPRRTLRAKARLDVQRSNGDLLYVSALDVSDSGIGFLCRTNLDENEEVGLRAAFGESSFEPFRVRRGTGTIGGFKIGVVAC